MRSPLVVTSVGMHIVVVSAFLVAGMWKLERLEPGRRSIDLAVAPPPPPPAASGSPATAAAEPFKKKRRTVTKVITQPAPRDVETAPATATAEPGLGTGGTGSGAGSGSGTDRTGTGDCLGDGCGPSTPVPPKPPVAPPQPVIVPPAVIKGLRIAGETQIHPSPVVKTAILRDGRSTVSASFRVCVGAAGEVSSVSPVKSSGYGGYDSALVTALGAWRYRPYEIGGRKVPVCGVVTFIYSLQ